MIKYNIIWLGYKWEKESYASDYFIKLFHLAELIIKNGKAYVDHQSQEEINLQRKSPFNIRKLNPYRNRSIKENISLFHKMKNGFFNDGSCVLRAKIDMDSPNMNLRDPIMYRIIKKSHPRTKNQWCIYPTYDWAHGQCDYIENISHSLCSIEFENHRPLYNWYLNQINNYIDNHSLNKIKPKQIEFARLNLSHTILSKRKLKYIIDNKIIKSWDDPIMPTISGLQRRGYKAKYIIEFFEKIGISKRNSTTNISLLENILKKNLIKNTKILMVVLNPIKIIIINYPDNEIEWLIGQNNPKNIDYGYRKIPFSKEIYIEKKDFMENPEKNFFRLSIGKEVRLKYAYIIKAIKILKNSNNEIYEIHCLYNKSNKITKSTIHWVSCIHCKKINIKIYNKLFHKFNISEKDNNIINYLNNSYLEKIVGYAEPYIKKIKLGERVQFQRIGYFYVNKHKKNNDLEFNCITQL